MILHIDTTDNEIVIISLRKGRRVLSERKFKARFKQAEKLLPEIDKMLESAQIDLAQIKEVLVADQGGSFTSLRIGVVTANALAYALGIAIGSTSQRKNSIVADKKKKIKIVQPQYSSGPNITIKKPR